MTRARAEYSIEAENRTGAAIRAARQGFQGLQSAVSEIGRKLGASAGVGLAGLVAMTKQSIDTGDKVQKIAIETGLSTEAITEFGHALQLQGGRMESLIEVGKGMSAFLFDAAQGGKSSAEALGLLGLSVESLQGMTQDQRLDAFVAALNAIPDAATRSALSQRIFQGAATDMIRVADVGAAGLATMREEARRLGLTLSRVQADDMAAANDGFTRLEAAVRGFTNGLAIDFAPRIADGAEALSEILLPTLRGVAKAATIAGDLLGGVAAAGHALARGDFDAVGNILGNLGEDVFGDLRRALEATFADDAPPPPARPAGGGAAGETVTLDAPQLDEQTRILREIAETVGAARAG